MTATRRNMSRTSSSRRRSDYQKATVTMVYGGAQSSSVLLPVVPLDQSAAKAR
jgi:hypothetical protein